MGIMRKWAEVYADILHIYFSPYYRMLAEHEFEKVGPASKWRSLKVILKTLQRRIQQFLRSSDNTSFLKAQDALWLFAVSKNNLDTLRFLHDRYNNALFVTDKTRREFKDVRTVVPILRFQIFYLFKFPYLVLRLVTAHGRYARRLSPVIFRSVGFYEEWTRILRNARPRAIVFANDHNMESRSLLLAAARLKIPTVYLQHASVSASFPPLKFDLNLLEGEDALDKYRGAGKVNGRVELIGMPKFDSYVKYRKVNSGIKKIGLPYNLNDDLRTVDELIRSLHAALPECAITIRKHPKDKTSFSFRSKFPFLIESNPQEENAFDFLRGQDCVIAGNSSIHLEAVLLNIVSIYFNMAKGTFIDDYYGYVKNGLVPAAGGVFDVIQLIRSASAEDIHKKASYFNATVGTEWEGKSEALVTRHIDHLLRTHAVARTS
jgi:hypothetical protein